MPLKTDPILPEARLRAMKQAGHWRDRTIIDYLDDRIAGSPERVAIIDDNSMTGERTVLTYAELGRRVERIALGLARLGLERGDVLSYQLPNWWQFTALHLAAMRLGVITNPLMPIFRERELEFMLRLAETKLFIVPRRFRDFDYAAMAEGLRPKLPALSRVLVLGGVGEAAFESLLQAGSGDASALFAGRRPKADDVIEILYTSGTTGEAKGVMHTSNTLFSNLEPYAERLGLGASDVVLMASPLAHQTGFMYGLMMPIHLGGTVVLQDIWSADRAADLIAAEGVTFTMAATPFLVRPHRRGGERGRRTCAACATFLSAGAPIPRALARRAAEHLGAHIISAWGMTENGAVTTTRIDDPPEKTFETDGCAQTGWKSARSTRTGRRCRPTARGACSAAAASNFVGYLKRPEWFATDADGWFETGDLARIDRDGYVRITGRTKDVIIRGGENIPVVEVEGLIYQHPAVQEVAVVAMPDPRLGERACAFVVLRPKAPA